MDPSASLPGDNTQQQPQYQQQYQPQYQPQDTFQGSFGGKGGGRGAYEPNFFEPQQQPQYQQQPQQQQNPFAEKQSQYESQISSLQAQLDKLQNQQTGTKPAADTTGAKPAADSELHDTGEAVTNMDPTRTKMGAGTQSFVDSGTLSNEDISKSQKDSKAAADAAAAKIDPATGKPKYQYGTYKSYTPEQLSGLSRTDINKLYKTNATTASKDVAQAKQDVKNAKTIDEMKAANATLEAANKRVAQIKADQKTTQTQMGKAKVYSAPVAATPAPATAPAPTPPPALAKGGTVIVHKGMTSKLKKQLKNK
jgi:hypothetical protein